MARENAQGSPNARVTGQVRFPPHEDLDEAALREVGQFRVRPHPSLIRDNSRRIPYNSGKKDFSQKTNRDSFQVFEYEFSPPGNDQAFSVLWDYNIGLVRMTSFFKCCKYSKTTPAKMLNLNPGLRDITHSITGGAITAQGYWMPFDCAKAVCATFCAPISPALIPLFGPSFPSECIPANSPSFGRMIISPEIIATSSHQAHTFRQLNATISAPATPINHHLPSPLYSACDDDYSPGPAMSASSRMQQQRRFLPNPAPTSSWTPVNHPPPGGAGGYYSDTHYSRPVTPSDGGPNPYLSAVPSRSSEYPHPTQSRYHQPLPPPMRYHQQQQQYGWHGQRYDDGYDAGSERVDGSPTYTANTNTNSSPERERCDDEREDAALALMGLSGSAGTSPVVAPGGLMSPVVEGGGGLGLGGWAGDGTGTGAGTGMRGDGRDEMRGDGLADNDMRGDSLRHGMRKKGKEGRGMPPVVVARGEEEVPRVKRRRATLF